MWEKMNRAVVNRSQAKKNQESLSSRSREEDWGTEVSESICSSERTSEENELESLSSEMIEERQRAEESEIEMESPMEEAQRN